MIDIQKVMEVYSGKPDKCRCGCSGTYRAARQHRQVASENRGYPYNDDEVNDKQVRRVVKILNENIEDVEVNSEFADVEVDGRVYTAYFLPCQINNQ